MATIGSTDWVAASLSAAQALDLAGGPSLTVQFEVAGSPDGKARWWVTLRDGVPEAADTGRPDDADVTVQARWPDFERIVRGELAADLAFMQGRLKVDGAYETLLFHQREWLGSSAVADLVGAVASVTD